MRLFAAAAADDHVAGSRVLAARGDLVQIDAAHHTGPERPVERSLQHPAELRPVPGGGQNRELLVRRVGNREPIRHLGDAGQNHRLALPGREIFVGGTTLQQGNHGIECGEQRPRAEESGIRPGGTVGEHRRDAGLGLPLLGGEHVLRFCDAERNSGDHVVAGDLSDLEPFQFRHRRAGEQPRDRQRDERHQDDAEPVVDPGIPDVRRRAAHRAQEIAGPEPGIHRVHVSLPGSASRYA